jgi:hypothetical protein
MKSLPAILLVVLLGIFLPCSGEDKGPPAGVVDPRIIAKLEKIVALREQDAQTQRGISKENHGSSSDYTAADMALAKARLALARERRENAAIVTELRRIITLHQARLELAKLVDELQANNTALEVEVDLINAQIELEREMLRQGVKEK